jgi:hypothetical protein
MSVIESGPTQAGLIARVQGILLRPKEEWAIIDNEPATVQGLLTYAAILSAIPAILGALAGVLLAMMFHSAFGMMGQLIVAVLKAVLSVVFSVGICFVSALLYDAIAPSVGGTPNRIQSLKAFVYSSTAAWVGSIVLFIPVLGWLIWLAGIGYSCYLLYIGVVKLMKVEPDKAVGAGVVAIVVEWVLFGIAFWIQVMIGIMLVASFAAAAVGAAGMATPHY